ncbi:MAG: hypothetical protein RLZZ09_2100 [Pseudomonadota bacterium]|jgi:hypothetical protein
MFEGQSVLDTLEGFLNASAGVVAIAEICSGIVAGIEERGQENMHPSGGCHLTHESNLGCFTGTALVDGIGGRGGCQGHHCFRVPGSPEAGHLGKPVIIDAHAEL